MSMDLSLDDARASLAYWEQRAERLPRRAVRARREAREMAVRWRARVAEAERAAYGRGVLGAMLVLLAEGRLPERARHTSRRVARTTVRAAAVTAVSVAGLLLLTFAVVVALLVDAVSQIL